MLKPFFAALLESIMTMVKELVREDKKASNAETEKDLRDRWAKSVNDKLRND